MDILIELGLCILQLLLVFIIPAIIVEIVGTKKNDDGYTEAEDIFED